MYERLFPLGVTHWRALLFLCHSLKVVWTLEEEAGMSKIMCLLGDGHRNHVHFHLKKVEAE